LRRELAERGADPVPKRVDGSLDGLSQHRLEFREGVFDRSDVGTIGRQVAQRRACRLDRLAHGSALVAAEIVHDVKLTFAQLYDVWPVHFAPRLTRGLQSVRRSVFADHD